MLPIGLFSIESVFSQLVFKKGLGIAIKHEQRVNDHNIYIYIKKHCIYIYMVAPAIATRLVLAGVSGSTL